MRITLLKPTLALFSLATLFSVNAVPIDYKIDPQHSATVFSWNHFGFSTPSANFRDIQGVISFDKDMPSNSKVNVTIALSSINSNVEALDEHLLSADFFDAKKYPTITFKSTKVESSDGINFQVTGDLTIKGVTQSVVLTTVLNGEGPHPTTKKHTLGFGAKTTLKRSSFGITEYIPMVSDEITIGITTEASASK